MITTCILILTLSAWLAAYGTLRMLARLMVVFAQQAVLPVGEIALVATVVFFVTVGTPGWLVVAAILLLALEYWWARGHGASKGTMSPPPIGLLLSLLPLTAAPLLGAPSYLALDSGLIAASWLGALMASGGTGSIGHARLPFALLLGWMIVTAATHGAWPAAAISALAYGASFAYSLRRNRGHDLHAS